MHCLALMGPQLPLRPAHPWPWLMAPPGVGLRGGPAPAFLLSSAQQSSEPEPPQEEVPALIAPSHGTKYLSRAGGAHACSE